MREHRVISAFPATGKTYAAEHMDGVVDLESSSFSWRWTHPDVRERHPDWPLNYVCRIEKLMQDEAVRWVLVSSHEEVRVAMQEQGIDFLTVYPDVVLREEYRQRMIDRGSPAALIDVVIGGWTRMIASCEDRMLRGLAFDQVVLGPGEHITDAIRSAQGRKGQR